MNFSPDQVTPANWLEPPFSQWSFQHVAELVPTVPIRRGDGPVWQLPRRDRDLSSLEFSYGTGEDRIELTVGQMLARTYANGFLVLHRGEIVTEQYFNGLTAATPHLLMSVSKSIASTVAAALGVDVTARVDDIVPELGQTCFAGASVQDLLDMRAGVQFREGSRDPDTEVGEADRVYQWRPGQPAATDAHDFFASLHGNGPHGGPFRYQSVLTDVLAWVLERAGQASFADLVARELWQPMGAEFDAEVTVDRHGNALADGGICATLRDTGRFGQLALQRGKDVVPAAWFDDVIAGAPDAADAFMAAGGVPWELPGAHYRNCWWVTDPAIPLYYAAGSFGQHVFVHVPAELVVVKLSSWPASASGEMFGLAITAARAIAAALT